MSELTPRAWLRVVAATPGMRALSVQVAIAMMDYMDWDSDGDKVLGGHIHPGNDLLAEKCGLNPDNRSDVERVKRATKDLRDRDLLYLTYQGGKGPGDANEYRITTPERAAAYRKRKEAALIPAELPSPVACYITDCPFVGEHPIEIHGKATALCRKHYDMARKAA
jgi:hypothetical protein